MAGKANQNSQHLPKLHKETNHPFKVVNLPGSPNQTSSVDWEAAAEEYIKGDYQNVHQFAKKHDLPYESVKYHARQKDWQARKIRYDTEVKQRTSNALTERFSEGVVGRNIAARARAEKVGMSALQAVEELLTENRSAPPSQKLKPVNILQAVSAARAGFDLASKAMGADRMTFVDDAILTLAKKTVTREVGEKGDPVWEFQPPDIYTFVTSPEECGLGDSTYPAVLEVLEDIFTGSPRRMKFAYSEAVLPGGIGGAKSTTMALAIAYQVRLVLSLRNPHKTLGRAPASKIAFIVSSLTEGNAQEVIYAKVKSIIDGNKWFLKHYPYLPGTLKGLRFDARIEADKEYRKDIYVFPGNSSEASAVGFDILGACIDEATLWRSASEMDKAEEMFNALNQRVVSRFQDTGWGLVLMGGSPKHSADFLQRKVGESRRDRRIYVCRRATWEVLPNMRAVPLEDRFLFDFDSCEILDKGQCRWDPDATPIFHKDDTRQRFKGAWIRLDWDPTSGKPMPDVDAVPNAYLREFQLRPERSKRDLGGRPSDAFQRFIPDVSYINMAISPTLLNPWPETALHPNVLPEIPESFKPIPGKYYTVHVDQAKSSDAYALALGHIDRVDDQGRTWCVIDAVLRFKATANQQVQLSQGREFILKLRAAGFPILHVSYDGWQSTESIQLLTNASMWAATLSVDKTLAPYSQFKEVLLDGRLTLPSPCPVLAEELTRLELVMGTKIDHPRDGSKDVADACCGVVYNLLKHCLGAAQHNADSGTGGSTEAALV